MLLTRHGHRHVLSLFLVLLISVVLGDECVSYPSNGICSAFVNYPVQLSSTNISIIENQLRNSNLSILQTFFSPSQPECIQALFSWTCASALPKCSSANSSIIPLIPSGNPIPPCSNSCKIAALKCAHLYSLIPMSILSPNCSSPTLISNSTFSNQETNCNNAQNSSSIVLIPAMQPLISCPAPFLPIQKNLENYTVSQGGMCLAGCCLPTPTLANFFKPGAYESLTKALLPIGDFSLILVILWLLMATLVPENTYQTYPGRILYFIFWAQFIWHSSFLFFQFKGSNLPITAYTSTIPASQDNSPLCAVQGSLSVFGIHALPIWVVMLMLEMHLEIIWGNRFLVKHPWVMHVVCWGVPTIFTILALALNSINGQLVHICLIDSKYIPSLILWPIVAYGTPAVIAHLTVTIHMSRAMWTSTKSSTNTSNEISTYISSSTANSPTSPDFVHLSPNFIKEQSSSMKFISMNGNPTRQKFLNQISKQKSNFLMVRPTVGQAWKVLKLQFRCLTLGVLFAGIASYLLGFFLRYLKDFPIAPTNKNPLGSLSAEWVACQLTQTRNYLFPGGNLDICQQFITSPPFPKYFAMEYVAWFIGILFTPVFLRLEMITGTYKVLRNRWKQFSQRNKDDCDRSSRISRFSTWSRSKGINTFKGKTLSENLESEKSEQNKLAEKMKKESSRVTISEIEKGRNIPDNYSDSSSDDEDLPLPIIDPEGRILALDQDARGVEGSSKISAGHKGRKKNHSNPENYLSQMILLRQELSEIFQSSPRDEPEGLGGLGVRWQLENAQNIMKKKPNNL